MSLSFSVAAQDTEEAFFKKAFGKAPPTQRYSLVVSVHMDGESLGSFSILFNPYTNAISFQAETILPALQKHLIPEAEAFLNTLSQENGYISDKTFIKAGFQIQFQQQNQYVSLTSPSIYRPKTTLNLGYNPLQRLTQYTQNSATWSGYVNFYNTWSRTQDTSDSQFRVEQTHTYKGLVSLENAFELYSDAPPTFDGIRLAHDNTETFTSYYLGDINGKQQFSGLNSPRVLGASIVKSFIEFGSDSPRSVYQYTLVLDEPAYVVIMVNNRYVFSDTLLDGKYDIINPSMEEGLNKITYLITSKATQIEHVITDTFYFHDALLKEGEKEFGFTIGHPYDPTFSGIQPNTLVIGGGLDYGYTSDKMLNSSLLINGETITLGGGLSTVSSLALWDVDIAATLYPYSEENVKTIRLNMRPFRYTDTKNNIHDHEVQFGLISPDRNIDGTPDHLMELSYQHSIQFPNQNSILFRTKYGHFTQTNTPKYLFQTLYQQRLPICSIEYSLAFQRLVSQDPTLDFFIKFSQSNRFYRSRFGIRQENQRFVSDLDFHIQHPDFQRYYSDLNYSHTHQRQSLTIRNQLNRFQGSYNADVSDGLTENRIGLDYNGNRGHVLYTNTFSQNGFIRDSVRVEGAIAYVNSHWGVTDRIHDGFILMYAPEDMNIHYVEFNSNARLDRFGPAILTDLSVNRPFTVNAVKYKLKGNGILQKQSFETVPLKRQGLAISIAPEGQYTAQGTLLEEGTLTPLEYAFGEAYSDGDTSKAPVTFFTNKSGRFVITPVKAGKYTLVFYNEDYQPVEITVKKQVDTVVPLGDIHVPLNR